MKQGAGNVPRLPAFSAATPFPPRSETTNEWFPFPWFEARIVSGRD